MSRAGLLSSIATRVGDYRAGAVAPVDEDHIDRWVRHLFGDSVQVALLAELDHILAKSYLPRSSFEAFFADVVTNTQVVGDDPCGFWVQCNYFNKQLRGASQKVLLAMFDEALQESCGLSIADCGEDGGPVVYIDDAVYTGIHVIKDLEQIISEAPAQTELYMLVYALHNQGRGYAEQQLKRAFGAAGKAVNIKWFCELDLENTTAKTSDVLWPKSLPDQQESRDYAASLAYSVAYRSGDNVGKNGFFSSGERRHLIEQEFLKAGALLRSQNQNLKKYARPLGNCVMQTLGFGALIVTFRNCANNCPLVFWAGDYPLFERDNN